MQQVMINLQQNAIKFTKQGGTVAIKATYIPKINQRQLFKQVLIQSGSLKHKILNPGRKAKIVISVKDTGVGISADDQQNLFKMFGTVKNTRQMNTGGIGLGLFICK